MKGRLLVVVFAAALVVVACGGDSDDRDAVIERLQEEGETPESAACYADELSAYDSGEITAFIEGENEDADLAAAVREAAEVCASTEAEPPAE